METNQKQSRLSIMQPYLFPYIGYFQLIYSTDMIVFCDDVTYIKNGWINRNQILYNNAPLYFSVPLQKKSSFKLIKDTLINKDFYPLWKRKFLNTLRHSYSKAPFFDTSYQLIEKVFDADFESISELAIYSVKSVYEYLGLDLKYQVSSEICLDCVGIDKVDRIVRLTNHFGYKEFVNPIGGVELYDKKDLKKRGIDIQFLNTLPFNYKQFSQKFVPSLSIIDMLMFLEKEEIVNRFSTCELI